METNRDIKPMLEELDQFDPGDAVTREAIRKIARLLRDMYERFSGSNPDTWNGESDEE